MQTWTFLGTNKRRGMSRKDPQPLTFLLGHAKIGARKGFAYWPLRSSTTMIVGIVVLSVSSDLSILIVVVTVVRIVIVSVSLVRIGFTSLPSMNGVWFRCQPIRAPCASSSPKTRSHDTLRPTILSAFFHTSSIPLALKPFPC